MLNYAWILLALQNARCDLKVGLLYSGEKKKARLDLFSVCVPLFRVIHYFQLCMHSATCTTWMQFSMFDAIWRIVVFLL